MSDFVFLSNADTGGQNIAIARAINKYTKHTARALKMNDNYIHYPYDLCAQLGSYSLFDGKYYSREAILDIMRSANFLIFDTYDRFMGWDILFEDFYKGKSIVYRHNGDQCRLNNFIVDGFHKNNNDGIIVSTPDLLDCIPHVKNKTWIPNSVIDEDYLNSLPTAIYDKPLVVGHSPTNPTRKGTFEFLDALGEVAKKHEVFFDPVANMSWYSALKQRALHHVFFDQITKDIHWYGNCSIESAWLGQVVLCNPIKNGHIKVPFVPVDFDTLDKDLTSFFNRIDSTVYEELSKAHKTWVRKVHNPRDVAKTHVEWITENAIEWTSNHRFLTDRILLKAGWRWVKGKGIKIK